MTELKKPLTRKTRAHKFDAGRTRCIVVTLDGQVIGLRLAQLHTTYWLPLEAVYDSAVKASVAAEQREKKRRGKR